MKIEQKGMPKDLFGDEFGDLFIEFFVVMPTSLTPSQKTSLMDLL
jgi:DnaJ-class molecular chaperone